MPLRRAGTPVLAPYYRDPGSAAHRFARATRCAASGELARLGHRDTDAERDEHAAERAVDPQHHAAGLPEAAGRLRREGGDEQAPYRAAEDENETERDEGECLAGRIGGD